ncbi:DUF397 domain-containing protein [Streptomyces sp. NPDC001678]|uniref:DUF397 domain-containing protein n=1 Tax=Streptomyces sp. NPDC001678 TaxID=3364599 RepID=UPI0036BD2C69
MSTTGHLHTMWEKSSYSGGNGGQCVEFARSLMSSSGIIPVRDSKRGPDGPVLALPAAAWSAFLTGVKRQQHPAV